MSNSSISPGHHCCSIQKQQVAKDIQSCRDSYEDSDARHACFRSVARNSKRQTVACFYS